MKKMNAVLIYSGVVVISILFIFLGNRYIEGSNFYQGVIYDRETELDTLISAEVISVDEIIEQTNSFSNKEIKFTAKTLQSSDIQNSVMCCQQFLTDSRNDVEVSKGDKVVLLVYDENTYLFQYYYRFDKICAFGGALVAFVFMLGGIKGLNTIVSLMFTCMSIFFVYIPSIKAGINIYLSTIIICVYIVIMMLLIVYGVSKKSIITVISCSSGIVVSGLLSFFMDRWLSLTGYYNDDMFRLKELLGFPVNVKALVFAMITIGALGAITDVSMSITSPLCEMKDNDHRISIKVLIKSGFNIGKDFIGTMTNTLILAYIGSSLVMCLIYSASNYPLLSLLNKEEIVIEFLQSLVGCAGILFTIPFTTIIASLMLSGEK